MANLVVSGDFRPVDFNPYFNSKKVEVRKNTVDIKDTKVSDNRKIIEYFDKSKNKIMECEYIDDKLCNEIIYAKNEKLKKSNCHYAEAVIERYVKEGEKMYKDVLSYTDENDNGSFDHVTYMPGKNPFNKNIVFSKEIDADGCSFNHKRQVWKTPVGEHKDFIEEYNFSTKKYEEPISEKITRHLSTFICSLGK